MTAALLLAASVAAAAAGAGHRAGGESIGAADRAMAQAPMARDRVDFDGEASLLAAWLPRLETIELRPRLRAAIAVEPARWLRFHAEGLVDGLTAERGSFGRIAVVHEAARMREAWVELVANRADVRAGYGRLAWGRLDEVQPSDVINPLDATRFLLEGRSEARRPVALLRARVYPVDGLSMEGVVVPRFERGVFDELDEPSSPFNLLSDLVLPAGALLATDEVERRAPDVDWRNPLKGARVSMTAGRVDVSVSAFDGADGFGVVSFEPVVTDPPSPAVVGRLVETYSRFRMYAADFETVAGQWAFRGEMAAFVEKRLPGVTVPGIVRGRVLDAGVGIDRRAGRFRVYATGLYHREWSDEDPGVERTDISVIGSVERSFARDTQLARAFVVVNPIERAAFLRGLWLWNATDHVSLEVSGGAFVGTSDDTIGRFKRRDFAFSRLRVTF